MKTDAKGRGGRRTVGGERGAEYQRPKLGKRVAHKERTKEKILKAALELFRKKGFESTATKEISRRAGIAEGTLFNYFRTKDDIALYFFERETEFVIEWYQGQKRLQKAPLEEKLFAIIQKQLEYLSTYESFIGSVILRAFQPASKLIPLSVESQYLQSRYLKFIGEIIELDIGNQGMGLLSSFGPHMFWAFYMAVLMHWLNDHSKNKEATLAFLDRGLKIGVAIANGRYSNGQR
ncbi:MAG: hypothetical protein A3J74_08830 [Elusimicrobia bacterium RIFCSPHIGHO2_02_FULL_57_9]|nr:MAG: hypothetical protein A3J74_08830 [Elusimicrobia bacterium RIFCSPHIGHO2_02_FULL_57_9]